MKRRFAFPARRASGGERHSEEPERAEEIGSGRPAGGSTVRIEEINGTHVLLPAGEPVADPVTLAELGFATADEADGSVTVVVGADPGFGWPSLVELLDSVREQGATNIRLAMSGAAAERGEQPAVARWVADTWDLPVDAPDGVVLLVPGGSLFVPPDPEGGSVPVRGGRCQGWWSFAPGAERRLLGRRLPAPAWQAAVDALPTTTPGGAEMHAIPAGVLLRPEGSGPPKSGDLAFAVPASGRRPVVLVGAPADESEVAAHDITHVLGALPEWARRDALLAPGRGVDLLPAAQQAADLLKCPIEVFTGTPLLTDDVRAAAGGKDEHSVQAVVIGADGAPAWRPFVGSVVCRPTAPGRHGKPPTLGHWHLPIPGSGVGPPVPGVARLSERWSVTATRAGLGVGTAGERISFAARPLHAGRAAIDVGTPGRPLDESVLPALRKLLGAVTEDVREHAVLYVHGRCTREQMRELSRLMADHGVRRLRTTPPPSPLRRAAPAPAAGRPPISVETHRRTPTDDP
ncbi:hypothetical protein [Actinacidiphila guanduensis]|uniref:Uncharacterized protein n=1 Tax=Actinacidiphila guanduensis TaxID=310781 RepID=A0A1H0QNQ1_9ACTN|nr:hypothetical protein [Actinacidiphila guanduensis]SDP18298.1 hypothetical protein SAMN05216259_11934 [Actinacidiphila guanduensis]